VLAKRLAMGNVESCGARAKQPEGLETKALTLPVFPSNTEDLGTLKMLSKHVNLDVLSSAFIRAAGPDSRMDKEEYLRFVKNINLPESLHIPLWDVLDINKDGVVTAVEFNDGLLKMLNSRAWNRFCPACQYDNTCGFCVKVNNECSTCDNERFCPVHWVEHPGVRPQNVR
jgi:hypothetical protein